MGKQIEITYKPTIETLMKVSRYLLLEIKAFRYGPIFLVVMIFINYYSNHLNAKSGIENPDPIWIQLLPFIILPIVLIVIYFGSLSTMKKTMLNNRRNFETQKISFDENTYTQQGETFKVESFWSEVYQVKETKDWILIYPRKNSAFPIVKSDLNSGELSDLRELFRSLPIKKSLK